MFTSYFLVVLGSSTGFEIWKMFGCRIRNPELEIRNSTQITNDNYGASIFSFIASKIWETIPLELKKNYVTAASLNTSSYICLIRNLFPRIYCFSLLLISLTTLSHVVVVVLFFVFFVFFFYLIHVNVVTLAPFLFVLLFVTTLMCLCQLA